MQMELSSSSLRPGSRSIIQVPGGERQAARPQVTHAASQSGLTGMKDCGQAKSSKRKTPALQAREGSGGAPSTHGAPAPCQGPRWSGCSQSSKLVPHHLAHRFPSASLLPVKTCRPMSPYQVLPPAGLNTHTPWETAPATEASSRDWARCWRKEVGWWWSGLILTDNQARHLQEWRGRKQPSHVNKGKNLQLQPS